MDFTTDACYIFLKDLITFIFTGAGLVIAGMGLATWKKQIKGTKEFDTAYNLHYSILKLRDAIKHVRHPAIFPSESYKALGYAKAKYPQKSDAEREKFSHEYVYEMRWEEIKKASTEVESHLLAAEVLWGPLSGLMMPLDKKITELNIALKQTFQPEMRTKDADELHDIVYDMSNRITGTEDQFSTEVNQATKRVADYLKEKIG